MRKCKHIYKARIHNKRIYSELKHVEAKYGHDETHVIKICTLCGGVDIDIYDEKLTAADFFGTPVAVMMLRYQAHLVEIEDIVEDAKRGEDEARTTDS